MHISGKEQSFVTKHIRNLRGGSQPILAQANDGLLYVVKFNNNLQGANLPFNESIGNELYRACGLAVPSWKPLLVTDDFLDRNPSCWIQTPEGRTRPDSGLSFGSRFLGGDGISLLEILPGNSFKRIRGHESFWLAWLIDICAGSADNRQAVFLERTDRWIDAFFVDNGHFFGGPKGELKPHFHASRYLDSRIYQSVSSQQLRNFEKIAGSIDADEIWHRTQLLPENWKTTSALDALTQCLVKLSTPSVLQCVLETMVEANQLVNGLKHSEVQLGRKPPASVLCPGVPGAVSRRHVNAVGAGFPACALG
jgi:hypothetical protein